MKVYSYMQARKGILATDIRSHTQALDRGCGELVAPDAASVAAGFDRLFDDGAYRTRIGLRAREKVEREDSSDRLQAKSESGIRAPCDPSARSVG